MSGSWALLFFALAALAASTLLAALALRWRRQRSDELEALVRLVESADPDHPEMRSLPPMQVPEFERLGRSFARFFDRFTASRVRQEEVEGTLGYVLDHAADAILILDRSHRIISWNRGARETFGFAVEEIVGLPYTRLIPGGEEEPELRTPLAPGTTVKDFRTRRLARDGRAVEVSLTRSRVPGSEERREGFVEILRDITATRRLEEDLLRTEKMAAVGKISSKVVHEIRNPLASINLNVDLLRDSLESSPGGDPEAREILGVIKREIRRLSQITEEYLQFSRLPRTAFRRERVNDILVELADFVRASITRKGIRLVLNLDESDPEAVCDATLLRHALLNLLRNAMDAIEEGQGQIQMGTRALRSPEEEESAFPVPGLSPAPGLRAGEGGMVDSGGGDGGGGCVEGGEGGVEITVEDNGRGIAPDQLPQIYDPFFTTKKDGTGLGLALVRRAVEEHGGRIRCTSVPGKGTAFRVLIPCLPTGFDPERDPGASSLDPSTP